MGASTTPEALHLHPGPPDGLRTALGADSGVEMISTLEHPTTTPKIPNSISKKRNHSGMETGDGSHG